VTKKQRIEVVVSSDSEDSFEKSSDDDALMPPLQASPLHEHTHAAPEAEHDSSDIFDVIPEEQHQDAPLPTDNSPLPSPTHNSHNSHYNATHNSHDKHDTHSTRDKQAEVQSIYSSDSDFEGADGRVLLR
jgi:hypothetical protein